MGFGPSGPGGPWPRMNQGMPPQMMQPHMSPHGSPQLGFGPRGPGGPLPLMNQGMPPQMMQPHMSPHGSPQMGFGPRAPGGPWPMMNQTMPPPMMQPHMPPHGPSYGQMGFGPRGDAPVIHVEVNNHVPANPQEEFSSKEDFQVETFRQDEPKLS